MKKTKLSLLYKGSLLISIKFDNRLFLRIDYFLVIFLYLK